MYISNGDRIERPSIPINKILSLSLRRENFQPNNWTPTFGHNIYIDLWHLSLHKSSEKKGGSNKCSSQVNMCNWRQLCYDSILSLKSGLPHFKYFSPVSISGATRWRSWLRHCATSPKVTSSIPDCVPGIFY